MRDKIMPEFELLCDNLHLTADLEDANQLQRLKTWWQTEVSRDITFNGSPVEQYKHFLSEAKRYLNVFLANKFAHMNAIQYAALHGYDHYLSKLNEEPDPFNQPDKDGMTPLHWAAYKGHVHTVQSLLDKGANPKKLNANSQMPLYSALLVPMRHEQKLFELKKTIFNLLLESAPKSVNHQDKGGESVFHLMAGNDHFNDLLKEALKKNSAALSRPNNLKQYPIHTAILNNKINNARMLLESNASVGMQSDRNNRVALHYAAECSSDEMMSVCIAATNDINVRDTYNKTPLILAAEAGNKDAISALLHHHANPDLVDCDKQTYHDRMMHSSQNDC